MLKAYDLDRAVHLKKLLDDVEALLESVETKTTGMGYRLDGRIVLSDGAPGHKGNEVRMVLYERDDPDCIAAVKAALERKKQAIVAELADIGVQVVARPQIEAMTGSA